jgi:hypothetical protein
VTTDNDNSGDARSIAYGAHQHHLSLHLALEPAEEVIAWADRMLCAANDPPAAVIDVSLAQGVPPDDLAKLLEPLMQHPKDIEPLRPVLGLVARKLESHELQLPAVITKFREYGVNDNAGSRWLPAETSAWFESLFDECVNIRYVYPSAELLRDGVADIFRDVVDGLRSLETTGTYHYKVRPAVHRARTARDAELPPAPRPE